MSNLSDLRRHVRPLALRLMLCCINYAEYFSSPTKGGERQMWGCWNWLQVSKDECKKTMRRPAATVCRLMSTFSKRTVFTALRLGPVETQ